MTLWELEQDPGLEGLGVWAPPSQQSGSPPLSAFSPHPHSCPSSLSPAQLGHCPGLQKGCVQGMLVPPGILGISPFSTSYGNAGRRGTGNWPSELWVFALPWRLRRVRLQ